MTAEIKRLLAELKLVAHGADFHLEKEIPQGVLSGSPQGLLQQFGELYRFRQRVEVKPEFRDPQNLAKVASLVGQLHYEIFLELGQSPRNENLSIELLYSRGGGQRIVPIIATDLGDEMEPLIEEVDPGQSTMFTLQKEDGDIFVNSVKLKDLKAVIEQPRAFLEYGYTPAAYCDLRNDKGVYQCYAQDGKMYFCSYTRSKTLMQSLDRKLEEIKAEGTVIFMWENISGKGDGIYK